MKVRMTPETELQPGELTPDEEFNSASDTGDVHLLAVVRRPEVQEQWNSASQASGGGAGSMPRM